MNSASHKISGEEDVLIPAFLSVVMPVYNEENAIEEVVADYVALISRFRQGELVLVNDASTDTTWPLLEKLAEGDPRIRICSNEKNQGHGPTLMRAYGEAKGDYIFHVDSDNQFVAEDLWLLWNAMHETSADCAIGRRTERHDPFARIILTQCLKIALLVLFGRYFPDANCPFRLYRRAALDVLLPLIPSSARLPSICLTVAAHKLGYTTKWISVRHLVRTGGQSFTRSFKIFRLVLSALGELIAFRKRLRALQSAA